MFDNFNDGSCPQCALKSKPIEMVLNQDDFWECPACHLQAMGSKAIFMILQERGSGDFKSNKITASEYIVGALMTKESQEEPYQSCGAFRDENDFRTFINQPLP